MITAKLVLEGGLLKSCRISGHANAGPKGTDIVCAAVTVLGRTVCKVLSEKKGIKTVCILPERGELQLDIVSADPECIGFLAGAGTFLLEGLLSVTKEYPGNFTVIIERSEDNGS